MGLFWPMCNALRADCRLFDPGHCAPRPSGRNRASVDHLSEATEKAFRRVPMKSPHLHG